MNCNSVRIYDGIFWVGVNDRRVHLFENLWPQPKGVSYNSYLIVDEKVTLIDTVEISKFQEFIANIVGVIGDRKIDYLVINHMEPDHSGSIAEIVARYPNIKLIGNEKTFMMLKPFYGNFVNQYQINDGDSLNLGVHQLKFVFTPMLHWPETMVSFESKTGVLFSGDIFGSFGTLDGGIFDDQVDMDYFENEMRRYFANIVGKYSLIAEKTLKKLIDMNLPLKIIAATHGPIWRSDLKRVLEYYRKWSSQEGENGAVIVYGSMYGNTAKMAEAIACGLVENGIKNVVVYDASKTDISYIFSDIWKYRAVILGSAAYNAALFPSIDNLIRKIEHVGLKNRLVGVFGTYAWSGGGVRNLLKFVENQKWQLIGNGIEAKCSPSVDDFIACKQLAREISKALL